MKITVLLIEDNIIDSFLVDRYLQEASPGKYEIKSAQTLQQGLRLLNTDHFDIVLTDLSLPDANGMKTISAIQECCSSIPIIVLSKNENEDLALEIVKKGAQDFLVKAHGNGHLINRAIGYAIERKRYEQKLVYLAHYDNLTGLANRGLFLDRLESALTRANRNKTLIALFLIDLDKFKHINDTLGHDAGDELLVQVADRFKRNMRQGDTIARLGGDEFTIIFEDLKEIGDVEKIANKLVDVMHLPFTLSAREVNVGASIGVSTYPEGGIKPTQLIKSADVAMYHAKNKGRNCYHRFTAEIDLSSGEHSKSMDKNKCGVR